MRPKSGFKTISLCIIHSVLRLARGNVHLLAPQNSKDENSIRSLLQVQDVLSHLNTEHAKGIPRSKFTLEIEIENSLIQLDVVESPSAILPSATYSVYNRPSREVGHLGYINLVTAADGRVVSLTVNPDSGEVRGVVKRFEDEEWIRFGDDEVDKSIDSVERLLYLNSDNYLVRRKSLLGFQIDRGLQAFHSNYLYQVDLHLDVDYELVLQNGGALCNVFAYINSLFVAANVLFEKEIMAHLNIISIRQTDIYDQVDSTGDALNKLKNEYGGDQWSDQGIDLHYALLGKKLQGGIGQRAGVAFVENSLCDSLRGFGLVSGVTGAFDSMDERFGNDLMRLIYALAHNFGSGAFGGDIESLLYSIGGYWRGFGSASDINSWINSPYFKKRNNPRQVSYNMFSVVNERQDACLAVPTVSNFERGPIIGECVQPNLSSKSIENDASSFEPNPRASVIAQLADPTSSPSYVPTYLPTYLPTNMPTFSSTESPTSSKSSKTTKASKAGKKESGSKSKVGKVSSVHRMFGTTVSASAREMKPGPTSPPKLSKTGKKNDRSKAGKTGGPKAGKNSFKPTSKPNSKPSKKPKSRPARKPTLKPTMGPTTKAPTLAPTFPSLVATTTIDIPAILRASIQCTGLNVTAAANIFELAIAGTVMINLESSQTLVGVSVSEICNITTTRRRLETVANETVSFVMRVGQNCSSCASTLFNEVSGNFTEEVNDGNFTRNLHTVATEQNVTQLTNVTVDNMTSSDFGKYTIVTVQPSTSPTKAPSKRPTQPPTNQPVKPGEPTRNPTTAAPTTLSPSKSPTRTPTNQPVRSGEPTRIPTTETPTTVSPSKSPTKTPTNQPVRSGDPTRNPTTASPTTLSPSRSPTQTPTNQPVRSGDPTRNPTTASPTTLSPSKSPTQKPTNQPVRSGEPTRNPTTAMPTTVSPSKSPTQTPTNQPVKSGDPTRIPTTASPTTLPPSKSPTQTPTNQPVKSGDPTRNPTTGTPITLPPSTSSTQKPTN